MRILRRKIIRYIIYIIYTVTLLLIVRHVFLAKKSNFFDAGDDNFLFYDENSESINNFTPANIVETARYEEWIKNYTNNIVPSLGENGKPAFLGREYKEVADKLFKKKAINVLLSNKIPLQRKLPDVRDPNCQNLTYKKSSLTASVIIIFHNEAWSVLLRTVYSVLQETPPKLLREIILVDDHSEEEELQGLLDHFIKTRLPKKVKLLRTTQREGLVRARLKGAENAVGDILVFLDAHCEATKGWLEPLLHRLTEKSNSVLMPIIDNISEETFEYAQGNAPSFFQVGGFSWAGHFTWINIQERDLKSKSSAVSPVNSPTMAGGLFAICRKYFWDIGSYDREMDGWGGENLEMSFRIWQCGGSLEIIPCSRVGHIFRNFLPYKFPNDKDTHGINTARLANVWMDDYKRLFFLHREEYKDNQSSIGDLKDRINLRKRLKCKSFKWYLDNVYPEKFVLDENVKAFGRVKLQDKNLCLDNLQKDEEKPYYLGVYECHPKLYPSQYFSLSNAGELRREDTCAYVTKNETLKEISVVQMSFCEEENREWILSEEGQLMHLKTGLCLDATGVKSSEILHATTCTNVSGQFWQFDFYGDKINPR